MFDTRSTVQVVGFPLIISCENEQVFSTVVVGGGDGGSCYAVLYCCCSMICHSQFITVTIKKSHIHVILVV